MPARRGGHGAAVAADHRCRRRPQPSRPAHGRASGAVAARRRTAGATNRGAGPARPRAARLLTRKKGAAGVPRADGQTFTTIRRETFTTSSLQSIGDLVQYSPGVSFKQGNGPRDMTLSIRGSGARVSGAMRNIVLMEDGFMMTQPDGFSRVDSTDPHAYAGVDVYRGPSSALFGNWANGGAVNFRTRSGAEIDGFETGHDAGSFGYLNNYVAVGRRWQCGCRGLRQRRARRAGHDQHAVQHPDRQYEGELAGPRRTIS